MTRPSEIQADDTQRIALRDTLRLAVPLHIWELRDQPDEHLMILARDDATAVGTHGDDLQYGGKHCAGAFNALARGLAVAALTAQGGADFLGLHWCAIPNCRAASRFDHADADDTEPWPDDPEPPPERPTEDLPDINAWTG